MTRARAEEIARGIVDDWIDDDTPIGDVENSVQKLLVPKIAAALRAERESAIAECAGIVNKMRQNSCPHLIDESCCIDALSNAESQIRALLAPPEKAPEDAPAPPVCATCLGKGEICISNEAHGAGKCSMGNCPSCSKEMPR